MRQPLIYRSDNPKSYQMISYTNIWVSIKRARKIFEEEAKRNRFKKGKEILKLPHISISTVIVV